MFKGNSKNLQLLKRSVHILVLIYGSFFILERVITSVVGWSTFLVLQVLGCGFMASTSGKLSEKINCYDESTAFFVPLELVLRVVSVVYSEAIETIKNFLLAEATIVLFLILILLVLWYQKAQISSRLKSVLRISFAVFIGVMILLIGLRVYVKLTSYQGLFKAAVPYQESKPKPPVVNKPTQKPKTEPKNEALLFFPSPHVPIKSTLPTISGKIRQGKAEYIDSTFEFTEPTPGNSGEGYYLRYLKPGRLKNVEFMLDGKKVADVFGFAQLPFVRCEDYYSKRTADQPPLTKEECLQNNSGELPSVLFFFKPTQNLTKGNHTLQITFVNGDKQELSFVIDPDLTLPPQDVPEEKTFGGDMCTPGVFYEKNFLGVPYATQDNPNLFYKLAFPQSNAQKGNTTSREVQLRIEGRVLDLKFPQQSLSYFDKERDIYLPIDNLYYPDGTRAKVWKTRPYYQYFEVFAVDSTGKKYPKVIPWETTSWSWCDG